MLPAVAEMKLSLDEFHTRYAGEKPYSEYRDGGAVQKSGPTRLHALIQAILLDIGYDAGPEVAIEILSPDDPFSRVLRKCHFVRQLADPENRCDRPSGT